MDIDRIAETLENLDCFIDTAERHLAMNNATNYQPAYQQPTIPVNGYQQMPPQAQAMTPAPSDLPWDPNYQPAEYSTTTNPSAYQMPQGYQMTQAMPQAMPQGYQQPAQQAAPQAQPVRREVPAGRYVCELADVRESTTKSGMPRISFAWRIVEGEYRGLWIWDNVTLGTPKGYEILGIKLAHIQPGWTHTDTADMYDEARQVRGWATARRYSVSKVAQPNGFFRIYADLIG